MGLRDKLKNSASRLAKRALVGKPKPHELRIPPKRVKDTGTATPTINEDVERLKVTKVEPEAPKEKKAPKKDSASTIKKKFALAKAGPLKEEAYEEVQEQIIEGLRLVHDPEIPVNIYDLGLIYNIDINAERHVEIEMTLTSPGCPVAQTLVDEVKKKAEGANEILTAEVKLVWEPSWSMEMMSEEAKLELDML